MTKAELEEAVRTGDWITGATLDEVEDAVDAVLRADRAPLREGADAAHAAVLVEDQCPASSGASRTVGQPEAPPPPDLHARLAAAVAGQPFTELPPGIHARLAAAVRGDERPLIEAAPLGDEGVSVHRRLVYGPDAAPLPAGIHARLAAAVQGRPYIAVPDGTHTKLLEALDGRPEGRPALPPGIHARLAAAVAGRPCVEVPEREHTKLREALDAGPVLPEGIHERLANALLEGIR